MNRIVLLPVGIVLLTLGLTALLSFLRPRPVQSRPVQVSAVGAEPWLDAPAGADVMALLVLARDGARLLELRGVEMLREGNGIAYVSPATPGQVEAILITADGRRWRAQWQEVQP